MRFKIFICAAALAGCATRYPSAIVTKQMADAAKIAVLSTLKDPASAQFGDTFSASREGKFYHICGTVNARNSFGGYTGQKVFETIYNEGTGEAILQENGGDSTFACALFNARDYSTKPPTSVLQQQGIGAAAASKI